MSTSLASVPRVSDSGWTYPSQPLVIGKDILELLSTSMYIDPMSMYREYIQNSADAVDVARSEGSLVDRGRVEIRIDQSSRSVFIRDNGAGLSKDNFINQLTAIGGSSKRGTRARGFRGVGRLAGLAFCQQLVFRSRQNGESTVHELRWDSREARSLLRSADSSCDLRDIVSKTIQTREIPGATWPERFFEVEMRGMVRHRDDRLLNEERVRNYLAQVAPVPFHPDFCFGEEIKYLLEAHGVMPGAVRMEILGHGQVYRPHSNTIRMGNSGESRFNELTTLCTPGNNGTVAAVTWILHHDYLGALPSHSFVDGWRFRCGDIQVGDNTLLQTLFPESRFNAWCVAETHVLDSLILPNGRRDHFEQNTFYFDLVNHLAPHARDITQRCRTSSIARNAVRVIDLRLAECQQNLEIIKKGTAHNFASTLAVKIETALNHLQALSSRSVLNPEQQLSYQQKVKRLTERLLRITSRNGRAAVLAKQFTPAQRLVLKKVFETIYETTDNLQMAQRLIDKIMVRLRRSASSKKAKEAAKRRLGHRTKHCS